MGVTLNSKEIKGKVNTTGLIATVGLIGSRGEKGDQGEQGNDGFSPIITTSKSGKVTTLTITDASGTKTATINDGADGQGSGDMLTSVYDQNLNGIVDNAEKVNNHTVESDVPSNAVFTDTTYTAGTGIDITNNVISNTQTSAEWGNITGTLSDQTDLKNALDAKQDVIDSTNKLPYSYVSGTPTIPTKLSDLTNDNNTVTDANYVHTDNNYTTTEKNKLAGVDDIIVVGSETPTSQTELVFEETDLDAQYTEAEYYSTEEVKTNKVWIDGKPIYRKCFQTTSTANINTGIENDTIIKMDCLAKQTGSNSWRNIPWLFAINNNIGDNSWAGGFYFIAGQIRFQIGSYLSDVDKLVLIMEYTKTTD